MSNAVVTKDNSEFLLNAERFAKFADLKTSAHKGRQYIEANSAGTGVVVLGTTLVRCNGKLWEIDTDTEVTTLDAGVLTLGNDYYVYLCDDGTDVPVLILSANSTYPAGYAAATSLKFGGFH